MLLLLVSLESCRQGREERPAYAFLDNDTPLDSLQLAAAQLKQQSGGDESGRQALAGIYMGIYHDHKGAYHLSRKEYNNALEAAKKSGDARLLCRAYAGLGNAAKNLGEYPEALEAFSRGLSYALSDSLAAAGVHANIAQVFQLQGDLPQAILHLQLARRLSGSNTSHHAYLILLHTLANVYGMNNKIDSALKLDEEGLAIAQQIKASSLKSTFLDNKANCYFYSGHPDSAREYFRQSLAVDSAFGDIKQMADTWLSLGELEQAEGNRSQALRNLNHGIMLANASGYRNGTMAGWKILSAVFESAGDYKQALAAKATYFAIKDSILGQKKDAAVAEWKAVYETERKEQQIRVQALQLRQKNLMIVFVCVSTIFLLGAIYYANRKNKERKERRYQESLAARDQQSAAKILSAEEAERRRIAADLHDGIGQTLTAAWLNLQAIRPAVGHLDEANVALLHTATQLVGDSCSEVRQISHAMMPNTLLQKGLVSALQEMVSRIGDNGGLHTYLSADSYDAGTDKAAELILYRVIQECVTNVVRHSKASELYLTLSKDDDELAVMIEDNGIGFNEDAARDAGIGMQNIRSRVRYLHGTVEWNSVTGSGHGTVVAIYIPLTHEKVA